MSTQTISTDVHATPGDSAQSTRRTYLGYDVPPIGKGLPRPTETLCPDCDHTNVIPGMLFEEDGKVFLEKTCTEHGYCRELIFSDVELYLKLEDWTFADGDGLTNPRITDATKCPEHCGMCNMHTSHTGLANVDLTNRCDMTCPVCFANANAAGYIYEPELQQIRSMLQALRDMRPVAARVVQFSGGEPTNYPYFLESVRIAKELGFSHVQVATNGKRFANEPGFAEKAKEAGLHTLYLQFDGISDDVYLRTRGEKVWETKKRAVQRVREANLKIVFVPTVCRGINDHQVGDILKFAIENVDCTSGISYQPVTFTGRIAQQARERMRYTLSDLAIDVGEQTGFTSKSDWYPTPCTSSISRLVSALRGEPTTHLTCHPHCSLGTYLFVDQNGKATPITQFVDVEAMLSEFETLSHDVTKSRFKTLKKISAFNAVRKFFNAEQAPEGLSFTRFLQTLEGLMDKGKGRGKGDGTYTYKTLMVAGMHFQDSYNYQVERVKRCIIHYSAPDGGIYPFCAYNSGPVFREKIESQYSMQIEDFRTEHGDMVGLPARKDAGPKGLPMLKAGGGGGAKGLPMATPKKQSEVVSKARTAHPAGLKLEYGDDDGSCGISGC